MKYALRQTKHLIELQVIERNVLMGKIYSWLRVGIKQGAVKCAVEYRVNIIAARGMTSRGQFQYNN
jgi:hypothetical protein